MKNDGLFFSIVDTFNDNPLSLDNLSLPIITELVESVVKFIKGSSNIEISNLTISIKNGSMAIHVQDSPILEPALFDYSKIKESGTLDNIDTLRAKVISDWQLKAKKSHNRSYIISNTSDLTRVSSDNITINSLTEYRSTNEDQWLPTETYLFGYVYDMGGKSRPNVHLTLQDGSSLKIDANEEMLTSDTENRLYKEQLVYLKAEQNILNREFRNPALVSFVEYAPGYDEEVFQTIAAEVTVAWADVPDIVQWVENIRGNNAEET